MRHLLICREYPPAPGGGIGTYALVLARLLAGAGEEVHVIGQAWEGAEAPVQEECEGRLVIHRLPFMDWRAAPRQRPHPALRGRPEAGFFHTACPALAFSWGAARLAERLVDEAGIELVEAQEYEAPLYYFLRRRALGLGPRRRPPTLVHLHSPSEYIARHNGQNLDAPALRAAKRLEDYCIAAATALLCPSRFLARRVEEARGLPRRSIQVIPLPMPPGEAARRPSPARAGGPVCYAGRLERRKGVLEFIAAAVEVAGEDPQVSFEFAGENILGRSPLQSELVLRSLVPPELWERFRFHGPLSRGRLAAFYARARLAAVPSRWENFPYACVEAMSAGLPVLATRSGGMPEMIRDGQTGWLAQACEKKALAQALRRALETPPEELARMGARAAAEIEQLCGPQAVLEQQLAFRASLAAQGAPRPQPFPLPSPVFAWPGDSRASLVRNCGARKPALQLGLELAQDGLALALRHPAAFFALGAALARRLRRALRRGAGRGSFRAANPPQGGPDG